MLDLKEIGWPCEEGRVFDSPYFTEAELEAKCQENAWLKNRDAEQGIYAEYPTYDYSYTAYVCESMDELKHCFRFGNWSIRQGFIYKNLAFINQVNAGDEWWTLKKFDDGRLLAFESVTFGGFDEVGEFEDFINRLLKATYKQCRGLDY